MDVEGCFIYVNNLLRELVIENLELMAETLS